MNVEQLRHGDIVADPFGGEHVFVASHIGDRYASLVTVEDYRVQEDAEEALWSLLDVAGDDALDEIVRISEEAGLYDDPEDDR